MRQTNHDAEFDLRMRATSDGQSVDFEVHVTMYIVEGVGENSMAVLVYPNPSQGMVTIAVEGNLGFEYQLFNFMGKAVLKGKSNDQTMTLDLSGFSKGIYFISMTTDSRCLTQKIIVE